MLGTEVTQPGYILGPMTKEQPLTHVKLVLVQRVLPRPNDPRRVLVQRVSPPSPPCGACAGSACFDPPLLSKECISPACCPPSPVRRVLVQRVLPPSTERTPAPTLANVGATLANVGQC